MVCCLLVGFSSSVSQMLSSPLRHHAKTNTQILIVGRNCIKHIPALMTDMADILVGVRSEIQMMLAHCDGVSELRQKNRPRGPKSVRGMIKAVLLCPSV